MTASSTSLAGSRRTTRRSRPSSPRTTNGKPPRRAACRRARAPRARVVRPASTPLGDGGRTRRTNPRRRTHARAIRRLRGRRSVQSLRRRRRGDGGRGTFAVRGGAAAERFRAAGPPGRRRVSFQRAARGNRRGNRRVPRRRSRRRSSSRRLAISPRVHVPVTRGVHAREGYPAVPASYVSFARRAGRDRTPAPSPLAFGPILAAAAAATPRTARYGNLDSRELAPVSAGPGSGPGVTITTARGRALGADRNRESPLGRVPEETIHGNDSEKDANGENRGDDENENDDGEKNALGFSFEEGSEDPVPSPAAMARPANVGFGGFTTGNGAAVTVSEDAVRRARRLFGDDSAEKTPRTKTPGGSGLDARTAKTAAAQGGVFATGSGKPVAVSEAAMRRARAMLGESSEDAGTTTNATPGTATTAPTTRESRPPPPGVPGSSGATHGASGAFAFVTGNGATVGVSAAALARARGLFDDAPPERRPAAAPRRRAPRPSPAPASAANADADAGADADADAGGFKPPFAAHAPAASAGRTFHSPMLPGAARRAGTARPAAASILGKRRATGFESAPASSAPSVHDLFASRGGSREPLSVFFRGLRPHERPASSRGVDAVVRAMTADTAIGYRVPSGDGAGASLSAESFRQRMLAAGAVDRLLAPEWVRNAHRWVVWHQACVSRAFPERLAAARARRAGGVAASAVPVRARDASRVSAASAARARTRFARGRARGVRGVRDSSRGRRRERRGGDRGERRVVRRRRAVGSRAERPTSPRTTLRRIKNSRARRGTTRRRRAHAAALRRRGGGVPRAPRERCPTRAMGRATRRAATRRGVPASNPPTRRRSRREDAGARRTRVPDVLARDGTRGRTRRHARRRRGGARRPRVGGESRRPPRTRRARRTSGGGGEGGGGGLELWFRRLSRRRRFRRSGGTSREGRARRRGTSRTSGSTRDETARVRLASRRSRRTRGWTHGRGVVDGV